MKSISKYSIILLLLFMQHSCGIYSFSGTSIPPEVETFSVGFFENLASINSPLLSQTFTEKLKQKFISETNLSIVETEGDFKFTGDITNFVIAPVSAQSTDNAQLNRLTITINVKLESEKNPKSDFEQSFNNFQDFDAAENFNSVEDQLIDEITDMLVQQVFNKAAINW
ncbi:MAG: LptE family protein [Bacteroidia bacterium]|nr:LptE family protein [Bacteroidia bacterium]